MLQNYKSPRVKRKGALRERPPGNAGHYKAACKARVTYFPKAWNAGTGVVFTFTFGNASVLRERYPVPAFHHPFRNESKPPGWF